MKFLNLRYIQNNYKWRKNNIESCNLYPLICIKTQSNSYASKLKIDVRGYTWENFMRFPS